MKKTNTLTALITSLLLSTASVAAVPSSEIITPEPIDHKNLINQAKEDLTISLSTVEFSIETPQLKNINMLAKQKVRANKNKTITVTKISLPAE